MARNFKQELLQAETSELTEAQKKVVGHFRKMFQGLGGRDIGRELIRVYERNRMHRHPLATAQELAI